MLAESKAMSSGGRENNGPVQRGCSQGGDEAHAGDAAQSKRLTGLSHCHSPHGVSHRQSPARRQLTQEPGELRPQESATFNGQQSNGKANRPGANMYALKMESITTVIN